MDCNRRVAAVQGNRSRSNLCVTHHITDGDIPCRRIAGNLHVKLYDIRNRDIIAIFILCHIDRCVGWTKDLNFIDVFQILKIFHGRAHKEFIVKQCGYFLDFFHQDSVLVYVLDRIRYVRRVSPHKDIQFLIRRLLCRRQDIFLIRDRTNFLKAADNLLAVIAKRITYNRSNGFCIKRQIIAHFYAVDVRDIAVFLLIPLPADNRCFTDRYDNRHSFC